MKVLLPVSRFRVIYEVAAGRPYSKFEALVLKAVLRGAKSVDNLRDMFAIHPRLIIDALVMLTQAGWLAVGGDDSGSFVLTAEGLAAVGQSGVPSSLTVSTRQSNLILERATGGIVNNDEVTFVTTKSLGDKLSEWCEFPVEVVENSLSEGQVYPFLSCREGEWIRWIGPIDMRTKGSTWVPLNVDVERGAVIGLPDAWQARLKPVVLEWSRAKSTEMPADLMGEMAVLPASRRRFSGDDVQKPRRLGQVCWPIRVKSDSWLFTRADHVRHIDESLRGARRSVFLASTVVTRAGVDVLKPLLLAAMARGVTVDVLWAVVNDAAAFEALKGIAFTARKERLTGGLNFNSDASSFQANLLAVDGEHISIGSFGWLSDEYANTAPGRFHVSLICRDAAVNVAVIHCAAAIWAETPNGRLSGAPDKWRRIASELERSTVVAVHEPIESGSTGTLRVVMNREHETVVRDAVLGAQERLIVGCVPIAEATLAKLAAAHTEGIVNEKLTMVVSGDKGTANSRLVDVLGGRLLLVPEWFAAIVICDDWAYVGSQGARPDLAGLGSATRQIGLVVEGFDAVATLVARTEMILSGPPRLEAT